MRNYQKFFIKMPKKQENIKRKNLFVIVSFIFLSSSFAFSEAWKIKNKWKVSCGIADKESLVVNGKPKKSYNKKEFKLESVVFKLD